MRPNVARLNPCNDLEYTEFVSLQVVEYARQLMRAGEVTPDRSVITAQERLQELRADRLRLAGHDFLVARSASDGSRVGWVWLSPATEFLGPSRTSARWLSQLTVEENCRGHGWGRAILVALEDHEAARGSDEIWLRVFDWNTVARHLYASHGYELTKQYVTDAHFRKRLPSR